ncbi:ATP-binding protein [Kosakonia sp.]|uniref:ATP-binding protein n=1 Tax=Kosakonia sp. TaxID=1916651 RepID=UPI0028B040CF|nr:ATP-binding protein [Kosakonia sp.]
MMREAITLEATLGALAPLAEWLQRNMTALPVDDAWRFALDLAVCEAATNVIRHALNEDSHREFSVTFSCHNDAVQVELTDDGVALSPDSLSKARRKIGSDEEQELESGRGIMLMLLSVDNVSVEREGGCNKTTLVKRL